jgi:hypothetical protein
MRPRIKASATGLGQARPNLVGRSANVDSQVAILIANSAEEPLALALLSMALFLHLSDIHFTAAESGLARRNEALRADVLNDARAQSARRGVADAILVTGDVAFSGLPDQYERAQRWLDEVAAAVRAPRTAVLVIPGNHDVTRSLIGPSGEAIRSALRGLPENRVDRLLDRLLEEPSMPILNPLANYNAFAQRYYCHIGTGNAPYWQTDVSLGKGWTLTFRGVSTVLVSDSDDARPNMVVGRTQGTLIMDDPNRIYAVMAHHPPDWWYDHDAVLDALRNRASLLLFGHKHARRIEQVDNSVRVVSGAVHPKEGDAWEPAYNWIEVQPSKVSGVDKLRIRIWSRIFPRGQNEFVAAMAGSREYSQFVLDLPMRPSGEVSAGDDAGEPVSRPDPDTESAPPPLEALRPPLIEPNEEKETPRNVVQDLLDLDYTVQIDILQRLNLLEEDDRDKTFVARTAAALARADERKLGQKLAEAVREASREKADSRQGVRRN